jgi:hypothetical protein
MIWLLLAGADQLAGPGPGSGIACNRRRDITIAAILLLAILSPCQLSWLLELSSRLYRPLILGYSRGLLAFSTVYIKFISFDVDSGGIELNLFYSS